MPILLTKATTDTWNTGLTEKNDQCVSSYFFALSIKWNIIAPEMDQTQTIPNMLCLFVKQQHKG